MPHSEGNINLHLGPTEQGAPDSLVDPIVAFIDSAKDEQDLFIAVQEIDHPPIAEAIFRARQRGATVKVVMEHDYLRNKKASSKPRTPGGSLEINRDLFSGMLRAAVDVKTDFNTKIFHQKFMVLGNRVLTGSTNFTTTGVTKNLNHIVVLNSAKIANAYKREFREISQGRFGKRSRDRDEKPTFAKVSGVRVKALFAPDHAPEMEITKQINKARQRIDLAVFTFAESSGIDDALIAARDRGVVINAVLDTKQANQKWAASHGLKTAGINIKVAGNKGGLGKVHHKLMTIDDSISIFGSFNYTKPANTTNDENIIIVGDLQEKNAQAKAAQKRIAKAARKEIDRIMNDFGRKF